MSGIEGELRPDFESLRRIQDRGMNGPVRIGHLELITNGLKTAVEEGWLTDEEAKSELRAILPQTARADVESKIIEQMKEKLPALQEALAEGDLNGAREIAREMPF